MADVANTPAVVVTTAQGEGALTTIIITANHLNRKSSMEFANLHPTR